MTPLVLFVLLGYSYAKRYTYYSHLILGLALACAPGGVWYAITGVFSWLPIWMMSGVLFWVAGFDILYSLQDQEFDHREGLYSIPARFGEKNAFIFSQLLHGTAVLCLLGFGAFANLNFYYWAGLLLFSVLLISQHILVAARGVAVIEQAFFTRNAWGSIVYFIAMLLERFIP